MSIKNVLLLNRSLLLGGAEKQSVILAKELLKHHRVYLVLLSGEIDPRFKRIINKYNIDLTILEGGLLKQIIDLYRFAREHKIDVIFSYLFSCNVVAAVGGQMAGVPHIIGGYRGSIVPEFYKLIIFWFVHNFLLHGTIINNHRGVSYFKKRGFRESKFTVIHNGMEIEPAVTDRGPKNMIYVLTVGRFDVSKDYTTSIKVFNLLQEKMENIRFRIVGYGELEEFIRRKIKEYDIEHEVEIYIRPDNLNHIYKTSDIYISTSIYEGLSNTIMEAMNFGLPVVATDVGDNRFLMDEGKSGYICLPRDIECLTQKVEALANEQELRKEMGTAGHEKLKQQFSIEKMVDKYRTLIASINT